MLELFEGYDALTAQLIRRKYSEAMVIGSSALKKLYAEIVALRTELMGKANVRVRNMTTALAPVESDREWAMLLLLLLGGAASGRKKPKNLKTSEILAVPFASGTASAATYKQWLQRMRAVDLINIRDTLARSVTESATTSSVVEKVVGTKGKRFADGILARTRNNIAALLGTLVTHITNFVRMNIWQQTPEVVGALWISVLDRATTAICRARDHKYIRLGRGRVPKGAVLLEPQTARAPAHVRCRSTLAPVRKGPLPDRRTYKDWLTAQPKGVQEDILGKAKAEMFRRGDVSLEQFVDNSGKEFTIKQLLSAA